MTPALYTYISTNETSPKQSNQRCIMWLSRDTVEFDPDNF